jgi:hypothetical protein
VQDACDVTSRFKISNLTPKFENAATLLSAEKEGKRVTDVDANVHESVIVSDVRFGFLAL